MQRFTESWRTAAMAQLDNPPLERLGQPLLWFVGMMGLAVAAILPAVFVRGPAMFPPWLIPWITFVAGAYGVLFGAWLVFLLLRVLSGGRGRYQRWFYAAKYAYMMLQSLLMICVTAVAVYGFAGESVAFALITVLFLALAGAVSMRGWHPSDLWNYSARMQGYSSGASYGLAVLLYVILAVAFAWGGSGNVLEKGFGLLTLLAFVTLGVFASRAVGAYGAYSLIHAGVIAND